MFSGGTYRPMTSTGRPPSRMVFPMGYSRPKSLRAEFSLTTATGAPAESSARVNHRPAPRSPPWISVNRSSAPMSCAGLSALSLILQPTEDLRPDRAVRDFRKLRDPLGFALRQVWANAHPFWQRVGIERRLRVDLHDVEGRRPRDLDRPHDLPLDAAHDRCHRHHRRHANDDAEDRQRRAQLARAQRVEGDADVLAQLIVEFHGSPRGIGLLGAAAR